MKIGSFKILGTLGTGAHSIIFHIRRDLDQKAYALKVVSIDDPEEDNKFKEQVEHEWDVLQKLDHANIIKGLALEYSKNWLFRVTKLHLLLEYGLGKTLDNVKGLNIPRTVEIFQKVASAMVHMHRREIFHGDLKPNNILLAPGGVLKVIDFGLAHIKGQAKGRIQGTPEYIAPETVKQKIVNERTDIFNFGATMYRMFSWKLPPKWQIVCTANPSAQACCRDQPGHPGETSAINSQLHELSSFGTTGTVWGNPNRLGGNPGNPA